MKKIIPLIFCLTVFLCVFSTVIFAGEDEEKAHIIIESTLRENDDSFVLSVTLSDCSNVKSILIKDITYNENKLRLVSGCWNIENAEISSDYSDGIAVMSLSENTDIDGAVFEIRFTVKNSEITECEVGLSAYAHYFGTDSGDLPTEIEVTSGKVVFSNPPSKTEEVTEASAEAGTSAETEETTEAETVAEIPTEIEENKNYQLAILTVCGIAVLLGIAASLIKKNK